MPRRSSEPPGDAHSGGGIEVFAGCDRGGLDSLQMDHGGKGRESDDGSDRIVGGGTHVTPVMTGCVSENAARAARISKIFGPR